MGYTDEQNTAIMIKEKLPLMVRQLSCPSTITKELIRYFVQQGLLYPNYSTLQDIVGTALRQEEKRLSDILK